MADSLPYTPYRPSVSALEACRSFRERVEQRRSVRAFAQREVPRAVIEEAVLAAGSAPSGANKQPWRFVCVADPTLKRSIRQAAEAEERSFYEERAPERWLADLEPLGTDANKPFLEHAPWLIAVFALTRTDDGGKTYYVNESVGIAVGLLLAALHEAGLSTLTHTPSPMRFLREVLGRGPHERPYVLIPVGYADSSCRVPAVRRHPLDHIACFHEVSPRTE